MSESNQSNQPENIDPTGVATGTPQACTNVALQGCEHSLFMEQHCALVDCFNYINKCPIHCLVGIPTADILQAARATREAGEPSV